MAREFTLKHFEEWCKTLVFDNGETVKLDPFQRAFVRDVLSGFKVNWLVVPEGNGKTTLMAALGLYGLRHAKDASIPIAASSRDQARIMFNQMRGFVMRSELWKPDHDGLWFECFSGTHKQIHLRCPGRTRRGETIGQLEVHAADAGTADGVIPYPYAILDELHRHKDLALHQTWAGKLDKRPGAALVVISTAGEPGHPFEVTRDKIIKEATEKSGEGAFRRYATDRIVMHEWAVRNEAVLDARAVKAANPLSTITSELLAEKLADPTMTEAHWRRFTCNLPTMDEGKEPFIDLQDWDELATEIEGPGASLVCLGGDGSRTWDTTVIAWAWQEEDLVYVDARVFSVREDIESHVFHERGKIDFDDVEAFIIDCFDKFSVLEAAYDPRYLERSMDIAEARLPESSIIAVEPSSKNMRDALHSLFNLAAEKRLRHSGDSVLRAQIANTGVERGFGSEIRRVRKVDGRLPIDAVPAMALAVWRAQNAEGSVYGDRELVMV